MKIVVDLQANQTPDSRQRGIGRYSMELAKAMLRNRGAHEIAFVANEAFAAHLPSLREELEADAPVTLTTYALAPLADLHGAARRAAQKVNDVLLDWQYAAANADVLHISSVFEGWLTGSAHVTSQPRDIAASVRSATLYDLIPLLFADTYLAPQVRPDYLGKLGAFPQLDVVLAISEATRQDAIRHLGMDPDRVVNIRGAVGGSFRRLAPGELAARRDVPRRHGLGERFLLYTGGIDYRKNIPTLIDGYARLLAAVRSQLQLAIVCAVLPEQREELLQHAARRGVARDRVVFTGYIPDDDLNALYNTCEIFIFPSLYEGFGLPLLEAMTCGACVAAANTSSLPEIAGRDDVLFDPRNPDAIVRALLPLIDSPDRRRELAAYNLQRSREFSWDRCARDAIGAFEAAADRRQRRVGVSTTARRPRLALFSPLPDQRSGIADYTAALLPHLAAHYRLDLYVDDGQAPRLDGVPGAYRVLPASEFAARAGTYATALYHFGNSEFHRYMYDIARAHPGIVVMHDFFLSGLVHWMDHQGHAPGLFARELADSHGDEGLQAVDAIARGELMPHEAIYRFPMSRRILASARGAIFHSHYARRLRARFFPDLEVLPAAVVPHFAQPAPPSPDEAAAARAALGLAPDDILICAFGFLAETKQNHLLLEALARPQLRDDERLRIAFVGELPRSAYGKRVRGLIDASPHARRIEVTGYASEETYRQHLAACDIAISLRALSRGETSGALLKNLAAGRATIVSDDAAMGEVPAGTVVKVSPDSADALADAIQALAGAPDLRERFGAAALKYVDAELRPARIAGVYAATIDALLARDNAQSTAGAIAALGRESRNSNLPEGYVDRAAEAMNRHLARHPILTRTLAPAAR